MDLQNSFKPNLVYKYSISDWRICWLKSKDCIVLYSDDWQKKYGVHFMFENRNKEFIVVIR